MSKYGGLIRGMQPEDGSPWIDVENWLYNKGDYDLFIASGAVYWPDFIEYRGCILRDSITNNHVLNYERLTSSGPVERGYVEERLNRLEISDIILTTEEDTISKKQALHIGRTLAQMWKAKLAIDFPDIEFCVSLVEHAEDDISDLEITFCQDISNQIG